MFRASALRQRKRRRENARNASCRNSLRWPIYTINVSNKIRVPCNTPADASTQFHRKFFPFTHLCNKQNLHWRDLNILLFTFFTLSIHFLFSLFCFLLLKLRLNVVLNDKNGTLFNRKYRKGFLILVSG